MSNSELPKKITPTPIKEAVIEIRFESSFPSEAIFGLIYSQLRLRYPIVEKLPILQIPEHVRLADPGLEFQPFYMFVRENFRFNLGAKVLSLSVIEPYPGWDIYLKEFVEVFNTIQKLDFIKNTLRVGIRYIDFFESDIFQGIKLEVKMNDIPAPVEETYYKTLIRDNGILSHLQIANSVTLNTGTKVSGSLIDIDTYTIDINDNYREKVVPFLEEAHIKQKSLFFNLLKPEFLAGFNPEY